MARAVEFARRQGGDRPPRWLVELLSKHLGRIESRAGIRLLREPGSDKLWPLLGCGSFGCVLALVDVTKVLKITSDEEEGPLTAHVHRLQSRQARTPVGPVTHATAVVFDVFRFPGKVEASLGYRTNAYGIVREAVDVESPLPKALVAAADAYTDGWEMHCFARGASTRALGHLMARGALETLKGKGPDGAQLGAVLEMLWNDGAPLMDAHRDNLATRFVPGPNGERPGQVLLFEYGASPFCPVKFREIGSLKAASVA